MNVDEATRLAGELKKEPEWSRINTNLALVVLAAEVERLRAEVEMSHSFHRVAVKERDFERLLVEALKEELAAAKSASVCPVELVALGDADWECSVGVKCKSSEDADTLYNWLRDRMKERGEG